MTLKIGITGGIGSGKSIVCKVFKALCIPVYHADDSARTITNRNPQVIAQIKEAFGNDMYVDGLLDRPKMAALVFNNPDALAKLNSIVHPAVRAELPVWLEANKNAPYILYEAAILFESGAYKLMDKSIMVTAAEEVRIERVMQRDNVGREEVLNRIKNQWPDSDKLAQADYVILNEGNAPVIAQVLALDKLLRNEQV
ncbi:MAG: dephospho-CoA kinase [Sphingobacteriales bacterium JAD_PAG50586_3]|nr:MAG: dephospho-CoA kinase [Sphingobacteriales bacterium JAD_PAG50586_3]